MPPDSNWKTPEVSARVEDLLVGLCVVERDRRHVDVFAAIVLDELEASSMTVSVVRPRKSIFSRPIFSTAFMS